MTDHYRDVGYASFAIGGLPLIHAARDRTAELLEVARARNVPVAACYTAYCSLKDMPLWKVKAVRDEFLHGHPCTGMDPKIHHPDNFTYGKNAPSMFFQTSLITFLVKQNVDTVIVTGCTTSGWVRVTIVDAFSYGFRVLVPEECCGDPDEGQHRCNLQDVGRRYADVTRVAEVEAYLRGLPAAG